ncbi:MAG: phosphoribosyltransferase family protein, partial [Ornithinibacter sp.]
ALGRRVVRHAAGPLVVAPALRHVRAVADQSGLGREERARNLNRALSVDPAWRDVIAGVPCLLVDDVVTTGATLCEAARAIRAEGASAVVAVTVAATPSRRDEADPRRASVPLVGR